MGSKSLIGTLALILILAGALNLGLVGLFGFNLISAIFSSLPIVERIVYVVVGVSALIYGYLTFGSSE